MFQGYFRPRYLSKLTTICFNECTWYNCLQVFTGRNLVSQGNLIGAFKVSLNLTVLNVCNNVKKTRKYCCWW